MATIKRLDTFVLRDRLGLSQEAINQEAQACAIRRSETMGWMDVSARPASASTSSEGDYKCYSFEIWGTEAPIVSSAQRSSDEDQKRASNDLTI